MGRTRIYWLVLVVLVAGCGSRDGPGAQITPGEVAVSKLPPQPVTAAAPQIPATPSSSTALLVDAMVGQVNGHAIYASTILKEIESTLADLGQRLSRLEFRQRVLGLISPRLDNTIFNRLALGEAQRELSQAQEQYLQNMLKDVRERLIREFGQGVPSIAEENLKTRYGTSIEAKLEEERTKMLIANYSELKIRSKINVTRRDVEHYYQDYLEQFLSPPARVLRLILVYESKAGDRIDGLLARGVAFAEAARDRANRNAPDRGGLFGDDAVAGDAPFAFNELNQAMVELAPGEHSPRITVAGRHFWVFVESQTKGKKILLRDARLQIEHHLRQMQLNEMSARFTRQLLVKGTYTSRDQMTAALMEVVMTRFARQP